MRRAGLLALLLLVACREEAAAPPPVELTAQTVGYFCQMNLMEHPGPKAQVHLDTYPGRPLFFDQVRDAVAYLRLPEQDGRALAAYATDMGAAASWQDPGSGHWVALDKALYVVGSDMEGGMGQPELVPFADPAKARAFAATHGGQLMRLDEIPAAALGGDEAAGGLDSVSDSEDYSARLRAARDDTGG